MLPIFFYQVVDVAEYATAEVRIAKSVGWLDLFELGLTTCLLNVQGSA